MENVTKTGKMIGNAFFLLAAFCLMFDIFIILHFHILSIYMYSYLSNHLFIYLFNYLSIHRFYLSNYTFFYQSIPLIIVKSRFIQNKDF